MATLSFRLVYDGLDATHHRMPKRLEKQIVAGTQELLGAHAYFLTEGRIPQSIMDHSKYFRIDDFRQKDGSWETITDITIALIAVDFLKEYVRTLRNL